MIEDKLYDLAMAYWDLQTGNHDIEKNHPELLDFDFADPDIDEVVSNIIARCRKIHIDNSSPSGPEADEMFRESTAPVPNNSVISVVARAIMAGGVDYQRKPDGWQVRGDALVYEVAFEKAGIITVAIDDCHDQQAFVQSLRLFTLDVLVGVIGQLCFAFCETRPDHALSLKAVVTARQILKYKNIKSHGERRWNLMEGIHEEIEKLGKIHIHVRRGEIRKERVNYQGPLVSIKPLKRDFNKHTSFYAPSSWEVRPGEWAFYTMSKEQDQFIGKLNKAIFEYDHREQRGAEAFAKKLMYALFILPGGTHYLNFGAKKSLGEYLKLIGEYREGDNLDRKKPGRDIMRLGRAIDILAGRGLIETDMPGSLAEYIAERQAPWRMRRLLLKIVKISLSGPA